MFEIIWKAIKQVIELIKGFIGAFKKGEETDTPEA